MGTWLLWIIGSSGIGLLITAYVPSLRVRSIRLRWRSGMWIGLFLISLVLVGVNFVSGLGQAVGRWSGILLIGIGFAAFLWFIITRYAPRFGGLRELGAWGVVLFILFVLAGWALGQPGNYDTGLYHLGAISYSADFSVIPGLANLHERFGFNSTMWPLSAGMGALGMEADSFRILNGVLVGLALTDLALRVLGSARWRATSPGTVVLLFGMTFVLSAIAQYPARLIASSAQDTAALVLTVVATAYLADAVKGRGDWVAASRVSVITAVMTAMMRPLGWVFAACVVLIVVVVAIRRTGWPGAVRVVGGVGLLSGVALALMLVRDAILSGWLLFPLGAFPVPVDWRLPDPSHAARDIQGWARTPFQDVNETLASNAWFGGWLARLPTDWSIPALGVLVIAAVMIWWRVRPRSGTWIRESLLTATPAIITLIIWFYSAPDPRFAWGFILAIGLIPVAYLAQGLRTRALLIAAAATLAALMVLAGLRGSFGTWSWFAQEPPSVATYEELLIDGTGVRIPQMGDQCWSVYPLCRPDYAPLDVELRGPNLGDGFRPG